MRSHLKKRLIVLLACCVVLGVAGIRYLYRYDPYPSVPINNELLLNVSSQFRKNCFATDNVPVARENRVTVILWMEDMPKRYDGIRIDSGTVNNVCLQRIEDSFSLSAANRRAYAVLNVSGIEEADELRVEAFGLEFQARRQPRSMLAASIAWRRYFANEWFLRSNLSSEDEERRRVDLGARFTLNSGTVPNGGLDLPQDTLVLMVQGQSGCFVLARHPDDRISPPTL